MYEVSKSTPKSIEISITKRLISNKLSMCYSTNALSLFVFKGKGEATPSQICMPPLHRGEFDYRKDCINNRSN